MIKQLLKCAASIYLFFTLSFLHAYVPYKQVEVGFDTKVKAYFLSMKDKIVTLPEGAQLLQTLNRYATVPLHKVEKFAKTIQDIPFSDANMSADHMRAAALMQLAIPIIDAFKQEVIATILALETSKKYWELQREDQPTYVWASYVQRLVNHTTKELNDKINALDTYLDQQFTYLGSLTLHLDNFDQSRTPQEHFVWLQQLCTIIISAYPDAKLWPHELTYEEVNRMVILANKCVIHYPIALRCKIEPYLMPNNFNRHLAKWSLAISAAITSTRCAYEQKETVKVHAQQAADTITSFSKGHYYRLKEAFFGNPQEDEALRKACKETLDEHYRGLHHTIPHKGKEEKEEIHDPLTPGKVEHPGINYIDQKLVTRCIQDQLRGDELSENHVYDTVEMTIKLLKQEVGDTAKSVEETAEGVKQVSLMKDFGVDKLKKLANTFFQVEDTQKEENIGLEDVARRLGEPLKKMAAPIDTCARLPDMFWLWMKVKMWSLEKRYRVLLAIVTSIPIYLVASETGKGAYTLYKKIRGVTVYDAIREALIDIAILLNIYGDAHPSAMAVDDYGRLIYLIEHLKNGHTMKNVPYEYRASFASHVQFLESSTLSAAEKLKMIDLMYKRYPFLTHDMR